MANQGITKDESSPDRGLQPGDLFGDYMILAVAGRGGMGVVYKAVHVRLRRLVALKLVRTDLSSDPGFEGRFLREATLAASIRRHENVVIVYDSGVENDRLFLAMEWVEGDDLRSILDREGFLDPSTAVAIVLQTAHALEAVHATMVHRDVKPANIIVSGADDAPHVYLTDFGIARPTVSGETPLTQAGVALGTPGYLAPEQAMGRAVDGRADLYALGCVLFEAISGRPVFSAYDDEALEWAHAHSTLPSLAPMLGSPYEPFDRFLTTALAIDPDGRHISAREFARALEATSIEFAEASEVPPAGGPDKPTSPRSPESAISAVESEAALNGVGAAVLSTPSGDPGTKRPRRPIVRITLALVAVLGAAAGVLAATGALTGSSGPTHRPSAGGWRKPVNLLSGPLGSGPTAGADANEGEYAFWEGTNGTLWDKWQVDGHWHGPARISAAGHGMASQPAVAVHAGGQQDVFWRRTGGDLWEVSHTSAWQKRVSLGSGPLGSGPTAGIDAGGGEYVFWEGTRGTLWERWQLQGQWHGPAQITAAGHRLASQPAVAVYAGGHQDVFWKGSDGNLWEISHTTAWQKPVDLGSGALGSAPAAGADASGAVYVFWEGTRDTLWEKWQLHGRWHGPQRITAAGHALASPPAVAVHAVGEQDVFWRGGDGDLWEISHMT